MKFEGCGLTTARERTTTVRRRFVGVLVALAVLTCASVWAQGLPTTAPEAAGLSAPRVERLTSFMRDSAARDQIAGAVVVIARGGKVAVFEPVGWMDVEKRVPMRRDTIFRMASMSKAVTSVAAVMLMEEGRLRLADPVSRYLPAFKSITVLVPGPAGSERYGAVPAKREITIRDLLTHTAGISYGGGPAESAY